MLWSTPNNEWKILQAAWEIDKQVNTEAERSYAATPPILIPCVATYRPCVLTLVLSPICNWQYPDVGAIVFVPLLSRLGASPGFVRVRMMFRNRGYAAAINAYILAQLQQETAGTHLALGAGGLLPFVGWVADLANAALYFSEGDNVNGAFSLAAAIPGFGYFANVLKGGTTGTRLFELVQR